MIINRIARLIDEDSYVNRIGYILTPSLIITSCDPEKGAKPSIQSFTYLDKKYNL